MALDEASVNQLIVDLDESASGVVGTQMVIQDWDEMVKLTRFPMFRLTNQGGTADR